MVRTPKIALLEKNEQSSLTLIWAAYQRSQFSGVESSLKNSTGLLSPYWLPNYRLSTVVVSEGAGVVVGLLQNRYMDNARGQFLSQDPSHLAVGDPTALKQITGQDQQMYLANPQQLNSYSYAQDNPLRFKDPDGKWFSEFLSGKQSFSSFQLELGDATQQLTQSSTAWNNAVSNPYSVGPAIGVAVGTLSLTVGPQILQAYGTYDTYQNLKDFRQQLWKNPESYGDKTRRTTATLTYIDLAGRVVSYATPAPTRQIYESLRAVIDSLIKFSQQVDNSEGKSTDQKQNNQPTSSGKSQSSSGGGNVVRLVPPSKPLQKGRY